MQSRFEDRQGADLRAERDAHPRFVSQALVKTPWALPHKIHFILPFPNARSFGAYTEIHRSIPIDCLQPSFVDPVYPGSTHQR